MTDRLDLPPRYRDKIEALLSEYVPGIEVWAYGSRVSGRSHEASDLDLVLRGPTLEPLGDGFFDLLEAIQQSSIPILVQAHDWARLPESFHREIERDYVVLMERRERGINRSAWRTVALVEAPVEIIDGDRGKNYPKQHEFLESGHCLFLNAGNVTINGFNFSSCAFISSDRDQLLRKGKLARHDVVLTTRGTIGNSAYFDESVPYEQIRINSGMVILRALKPALNPRYLYLVIRSGLFLAQVQALRTGSAQPQLPIRDIRKIYIPLPPLPEQRAIAHVLGTLDDKIELNRRMNETLEEMARALFKSWFVDFLPVRAKMAAKQNNPSLLLPQAESGTWFVYAIECADGSLDIGQTENLRQRWLQHSSSKGGRWTKSHPPQRVAYWEKQPSRQAAVEREKWLKTGFGRKWLKKEIATRTQTGDPVRAKLTGRDTGLPPDVAALFPDRLVDSELGPIPEGWEVKALGELIELAYGKALKADDRKSGAIPVYGSNGRVGWHDKKLAAGPGIVVGRKGNPGIVTWTHSDFFPIDTTFYVVPRSTTKELPFLFFALIAQDLPSVSADSAVPGLNRNLAYMNRQLVPDKLLVDEFNHCARAIFTRRHRLEEESRALAALRGTLLPKLVSGEMRMDKENAIDI